NAPLGRRAEHHQVAAEVARAAGQLDEILGSPLPDGGIVRGQLHALRFGEEPVQTNDLDAVVLRLLPHLLPAVAPNVGDERGEGEGSDFESSVAKVRDVAANARMAPALECLVADGVFHE